MSHYRPEFEAALRLPERISKAMDDAGYRPPVLVGGAAVEIYTRGAVTTGDFDLSCGRQDILEDLSSAKGSCAHPVRAWRRGDGFIPS